MVATSTLQESKIPAHKKIFQTHKSIEYIKSKPKLANALYSWIKQRSRDFNYNFFDNVACEIFMREHYSGSVYEAYRKLPMAVMRADLWRYCVIYHFGGIYSDADTICRVNPNIFINEALLTCSPELGNNYFCQWTFSAPAKSPILKTIIDLCVERILGAKEFKGEHIIHYMTGPACFTDGIFKYIKENNLPFYEHVNQYQNYPSRILAVFNADNFHNKFIQHLYAGNDRDGWKRERYRVLV